MKTSIAISLLILAVAALFGWRDHGELLSLRAENVRLKGEAAVMGIAPDDPDQGKHRSKKRRADKLEEARAKAIDIIELARELERLMESGEGSDVATQDRILKALETFGALDNDQLEILIEAFSEAEGLGENMQGVLLSFAFEAMIERNPKDALALLLDQQSLPDKKPLRSHLVSQALVKWSESDPGAALAWLRGGTVDFMKREEMEKALVHGAARSDLRLAMKWIGEFGVSDKPGVIARIAGDLESLPERADLLRLMREQPDTFGQKEIDRALSTMGGEIAKSGFQEAAKWIEGKGFSESEITNLISGGLISQSKGDDRGRWVEWMGDNLSGENRERLINANVAEWTKKDHRAAGEWLAALPDGAAKAPAVAAFAKTVAPYDPEIAAQWAMTLPAGEKRDEILKEVERIRAEGKKISR